MCKNPKIKKKLERAAMITRLLIYFTYISYTGFAVMIFCYPVIWYLIFDELIPHFGFVIPWIDWTTRIGYFINFFHHTIQIFCVVLAGFAVSFMGYYEKISPFQILGMMASNSINILVFLNTFGMYDSLFEMLDELNEIINSEPSVKRSRAIKEQLKEVALVQNELYKYFLKLKSLLFINFN